MNDVERAGRRVDALIRQGLTDEERATYDAELARLVNGPGPWQRVRIRVVDLAVDVLLEGLGMVAAGAKRVKRWADR